MARPKASADQNSLYFTQLRDAERKILREALDYHEGNTSAAARMLGISHTLVWQRSRLLGGVYAGEPRCEPFDYEERKEAIRREKSRHRDSATQLRDDVRREAADEGERAPDRVDGPQTGDGDQTVVE